MNIFCIGLSYRTAPLALVEKLTVRPEAMDGVLARLRSATPAREAVLFSTCHRTEAFLFAPKSWLDPRDNTVACLVDGRDDISRDDVSEAVSVRAGHEAVRHLFRVVAGADSAVLGEQEILGQVQRQFRVAESGGHAGEVLRALVTRGIAFGRRARHETAIARGNVSFASVAWEAAEATFPDMAARRVLVVGAGEIARLVAVHFLKRGVAGVTIVNRTRARAEELCADTGARASDWSELPTVLAACDAAVCATAAGEHVVTAAMARAACAARDGAPLVLVDLSVPANIDPHVAVVPGVRFHSMEDVSARIEQTNEDRRAALDGIEEMVRRESERFDDWLQSRRAERLVAAIRRRVDDIRQQQVDRYGNQFDDRHRECLDTFAQSLLKTVMHDLTQNVRRIDLESEVGPHEFELACRLFNIPPESLDGEP